MNPYRLHAYLLLLLVSLIWGVAAVVIKFTLEGIPALPFLTYRFAISSIFALFYFALFGFHFPKKKKNRINLFLYGFLTSTLSLGFLFLGLEKTTVLEMVLITLVGPLMVVAAGVLFLNEHVTLKEKIGVGIALAGTIFTVFQPIIEDGAKFSKISGNILVLLSLLASTASVVLAKKLLRNGVNPVTMTNTSFLIGFLTIAPLALLRSGAGQTIQVIANTPLPYHLGVLFMALISGTLAYFLANKAQKTVEIGEAAVFSYLSPIFSAPLAVFWLGEKITTPFMIGAIVITIGVVIAEYKRSLRPNGLKNKRISNQSTRN